VNEKGERERIFIDKKRSLIKKKNEGVLSC